MSVYHVPVLFDESLEGLAIRPAGIYVDLTFGGGGHSRGILHRLGPQGRLFAFDQDRDARANLPEDPRLTFVESNFRFTASWPIWAFRRTISIRGSAVFRFATMRRSTCG